MMKATKLTFAALLLAGSTGLAMAQGADSGGVANGKPANADTLNTSKQQSHELNKNNKTKGATGGAMMQKNTGMPTDARNPANAGPDEAGTAKDTAGSGTQRNPAAQKQ
jgi:hypothetical protein